MSEPGHTALKPLESLAYAQGAPCVSAVIKREFADFRVDEELAFQPSGDGDHVFLQVMKVDASTTEVAKHLGSLAGIGPADVGYSGMKDRRGETSQWFSLKLPREHEGRLENLADDRLRLLDSQRNERKLKIGSHARNRFRLRLRDCEGPLAEFERRLEGVRVGGVPNYFGAQRFGAQMSNLQQVAELMRQVLAGQADPRRLPRFRRGMLYSAARSYLFNQVLAMRIERGTWDRYVAGDVMSLDGSGRCFVPSEWDEVLQQRLVDFDIHPTGPLPGKISPKDKYVSAAEAADIEEETLAESRWMVEGLQAFGLEAARRPLRFRAADLAWRWEQGATGELPDLCLEFTLPRGAYATSLLRELCLLRDV